MSGSEWLSKGVSPGSWRAATALTFVDATSATSYREMAERCAVVDLATALRNKVEVAAGPNVAGAVSRVLLQDEGLGRTTVQWHWFQRGEHLVQVTRASAPLEDGILASVAEQVLSGLGG